jgi:hypothetical protein
LVSDRVHLVWEVIPFEKKFLSAPIHSPPPLSGRLIGPSPRPGHHHSGEARPTGCELWLPWGTSPTAGSDLARLEKHLAAVLILPGEDHVWFEDRWMVASWCDE